MNAEPRILNVITRAGKWVRTDKHFDPKVDHLSEYDAIIVEPTWAAMFGGRDQEPGTSVKESVAGLIDEYEVELSKRATELPAFFQLGGVLVVRIDLPVQLRAHREEGWASSRTKRWTRKRGCGP